MEEWPANSREEARPARVTSWPWDARGRAGPGGTCEALAGASLRTADVDQLSGRKDAVSGFGQVSQWLRAKSTHGNLARVS